MTYDDWNLGNRDAKCTETNYWLANTATDYAYLCYVNYRGDCYSGATACWGVRPVVSLVSGVYVSGGSGTEADPYILAKE